MLGEMHIIARLYLRRMEWKSKPNWSRGMVRKNARCQSQIYGQIKEYAGCIINKCVTEVSIVYTSIVISSNHLLIVFAFTESTRTNEKLLYDEFSWLNPFVSSNGSDSIIQLTDNFSVRLFIMRAFFRSFKQYASISIVIVFHVILMVVFLLHLQLQMGYMQGSAHHMGRKQKKPYMSHKNNSSIHSQKHNRLNS